HPVTVRLTGEVPVGATCAWSFDDGDGPQQSTFDCAEPINFRARYGRPAVATVEVSSGPEAPQRVTTEIMVRDIFIAGLGDSIASGEGNPDRPIALSDEGFCFRYYLGTAAAQYYRPSRAGYKGGRACEAPDTLQVWQRQSALGLNAACQGTVNAQLAELRDAVTAARRRQPERKLDLILMSIGANDINFSGLVADAIVDTPTERVLFRRSGVMGSVDDSRAALAHDLPQSFGKLREALKPLVGGDLSHVVYVSYANPTLADGGAPCPGGRAGFDIHPSFNAQPQRLANVSGYVQNEFLPQLKALALCQSGVLCRDPGGDRMTFVEAHQAAFADHGFCARGPNDPEFDRECFSAKGDSFDPDIVTSASQPMVCG